jgi:2-polyprenyl-3-methyl-5-hydroxy-6-metoxy-1,4-benzoquinol methylase
VKFLDRVLQSWRIAKARPFIPAGAVVLDVGCGDGALFRKLKDKIGSGLGIEPTLTQNRVEGSVQLIAGRFPDDMPSMGPFDAITMLAVVEHIPPSQWTKLSQACCRWLKPAGLLVITVPSPRVDRILQVLRTFHLIDGMSLEEHHGYEVENTEQVFCAPDFELREHVCFQLGLNHLFVFARKE